MRNIFKELNLKIKETNKIAKKKKIKTVFFIGNTRKKEQNNFYLHAILF